MNALNEINDKHFGLIILLLVLALAFVGGMDYQDAIGG